MDTKRHGLALLRDPQSFVDPNTPRIRNAEPQIPRTTGNLPREPRSRSERAREFAAVEFRNELPQDVLARYRETNVLVSSSLAVGCLVSITAVAAGVMTLYQVSWPLAVAFYPLAGAVIARQQRGLELLVHDGSHRAWYRKNPKVNDFLTNVLAAYPSFTDVAQYWVFHKIHHADYGSEQDPCKRRFESMRSAFEPGGLLPTMVSYATGWYREAARKPAALVRAAAWHLCVFLIPLGMALGWSTALIAWALFWLIPQFAFLPWLRFIAELEEHDYSDGQTESSGTYTNVGWLHTWIVHPLKDGYHLIHHAFPSVPQWKHKALHKLLMEVSPKYRSSRGRTKLLGGSTALRNVD
jgi:fatty acid desaturase